jgi:hypothetical protein
LALLYSQQHWFLGKGHVWLASMEHFYQAPIDYVRRAKMGLLLHDASPLLRDNAASRRWSQKPQSVKSPNEERR